MLKYILFDLDNTLYSKKTGVMAAIGERIHQYMQEQVGLDAVEARDLRRRYLQTYGTTLKGLQLYHDIDTEEYLDYVHDVPLSDYLKPDEVLDRVLTEIQTEKIVFTSATTEHAHRVLRILGVERHFSRIFDVRAIDFENKSQPEAYRRVLGILKARPEECLMVEDSVHNLRPAKELGMVTVLVSGNRVDGVDFVIGDVTQVGEVFKRIQDSRFVIRER